MGEDEGNRLAGLDRQLTEYFSLVTVKCGRRSQDQTLRTGNRVDRASIESIDPWHGRPVVKTHHKLSTKKATRPDRPITIRTRSAPPAGDMKSTTAAEPDSV